MLAEFIPWNPFLGSINHKRLKIQAQMYRKTIAYLKTDRHTDRQTYRTDKHRMGEACQECRRAGMHDNSIFALFIKTGATVYKLEHR